MTKLITILIIILPKVSFGQDINDSLITTFYNKTIALYFSETSFSNKTKFERILLLTDFDTIGLIKYSDLNKFKYFDSKTNKHSVLDHPFKINNGRNIYWVNHKILEQDTIDINIGGWTIENVTKKTMSLSAWCGGTMGYIPDGRFIFEKEKKTWTFVSRQEIINQKK
jgi:hypothetical protein